MITSFEIHQDQSDLNLSTLIKLVGARCLITAVLFYIATPFQETFDLASLAQIQNILIADAITTPLLRVFDLYGFFMRYVLGPWVAVTQADLNVFWQGLPLTLAERYTDVLKTIFVGLYFSVPLPSGLFITAFAMLSTYIVDKYSLFYVWKRQAMLDNSLGKFARYFLCLTLFVHVQISRVYYANWPYGGLNGSDSSGSADCGFFTCSIKEYVPCSMLISSPLFLLDYEIII
jgi:hypothetical protein